MIQKLKLIINQKQTQQNNKQIIFILLTIGLIFTFHFWLDQRVRSDDSFLSLVENTIYYGQNQAFKWRTNFQTQIYSLLTGNSSALLNQIITLDPNSLPEGSSQGMPVVESEVKWQTVAKENESLRAALNLMNSESVSSDLIPAPILSLTQRLIEIPTNYQPVLGQVVVGKKSLLGWVNQVNMQRATVNLLKDNTNVRIIGRSQSGATGLVINRKGNLYLTEVPTQMKINVGDVIVTENQIDVPAGLELGRIQSVSTDESGSIQTALLLPEEYFGELPMVWLKKNHNF